MSAPTEADMIRMQWSHEDAWHDGNRAGIAHGKAEAWREAIEALRAMAGSGFAYQLERIAKERGYVA